MTGVQTCALPIWNLGDFGELNPKKFPGTMPTDPPGNFFNVLETGHYLSISSTADSRTPSKIEII